MRDDIGRDPPKDEAHTRQEKIEQVAERQAFLSALRAQAAASGDDVLGAQADALQRQYHASDHSRLQEDVYFSAAHQPASPALGYVRASENPQLLAKLGVNWSERQLKELLQPDDSDFRAEIYLPDPAIHGPGAKPVIVFKGSNGPVVAQDSSGRSSTRESALSDWIENARQAQGLESDHYTRAMDLATDFRRDFGKLFELSGHSKGGGQALAAAAVTNMPAHTSNAATLHPDTARRYARKNGLEVHDVDSLAHGYFVRGEVLHDGLGLLQGMSRAHQEQLAGVVRRFGELSQLPEARTRLDQYLEQALPHDPRMRDAAKGLVDELAARANGKTLQAIPMHAAAARLVELEPKSRSADGTLVDRPWRPSLPAAGVANILLLDAMSMTTQMGIAGKRTGEVVAAGGRQVERGAGIVAEGSRAGWEIVGSVANAGSAGVGQVLGASVRYQGEVVAGARLAGGHLESLGGRAVAQAEEWSNSLNTSLMRKASELPFLGGLGAQAEQQDRASAASVERRRNGADQSLSDARRDASQIGQASERIAGGVRRTGANLGAHLQDGARQAGEATAEGLRTAGTTVRVASDRVPTLGAAYGLTLGMAANTRQAIPVAIGLGIGKASAEEATARHGMKDVVQPSMDARTIEMERAAQERARQLRQQQVPTAPAVPSNGNAAVLIDDPRHPAFGLYQGAERGVHAQDARIGRQPDLYSRQMAGSLAAEMHVAGGSRIDHVALSGDASKVFGVQGPLDDPGHLRVSVGTVAAMNTPLIESSQRASTALPQHSPALALEQQQEHARSTGPRLV